MDAPYRESAAGDGKGYRPMRVLLREYRWPGSPRVLWAAVPFLGVVVWEAWKIFSAPPAMRSETGFSTLMTFGLMAVSILYIVHRAYGGANDAVRIYEDGIAMQRDGSATEIRWDDVASLTSDAFRDEQGRPGERHVLAGTRGGVMTLMTFTHALEGIDELATELCERVLARALPRAILAFRAGTPQRFGPVRVERGGVGWDGHALVPWADVRRADVQLGALVLRHAAGTERFERLPNAHVVSALVEHARAE
jgi:hypothetical protein